MSNEPKVVMKIVSVGDHVHLGRPGPLAGYGVTVIAIDEEWVTVNAGKYGEIGCPIDDLVVPDCAHCCDDPPPGHRCPSCGRLASDLEPTS